MKHISFTMVFIVVCSSNFAIAKDCKAVETAPGVKTKPVGCSTIIPDLPSKSADRDRIKTLNDGYKILPDGTRIRIFGRVEAETVFRR